MNFLSIVLFIFLLMYMSDFLTAYIAYLLAGEKMPFRKIFIWQFPAAIIQSIVYSVLMMIDNADFVTEYFNRRPLGIFVWLAIVGILEIPIICSWVYFLFRDTDAKRRFFYISTSFPFGILASYGANVLYGLFPSTASHSTLGDAMASVSVIALRFVCVIFIHIAIALVMYFVSKTSLWRKLQEFGNYPKMHIPMGLIFFLYYVFMGAYGPAYQSINWSAAVVSLPYIVLLGVVVIIVSDIKRTENLNTAKELLTQQQTYIKKLEAIQREIRGIQHDYKNILSGLYAQASDGNAEAVKEYIDTTLLKVDEAVSKDLRQMNQLTRIEIPELKGLIMTKIQEAERDQLSIQLEVVHPVNRSFMDTEDMLRCVGILLDNAIDSVREQKEGAIVLVLLQEENTLTIIVKNTVTNKPDMAKISMESYSTKGVGRGIGLSNYRKIVGKYSGATMETKIERDQFVQTLVLLQ